MTLLFYAQPYDISAVGFYFETIEEYDKKASGLKNRSGDKVEEFEIQFIDGEDIDTAFAAAWGLSQCNIAAFIEAALEWEDDHKTRYVLAVGECGYDHEQVAIDPDRVDIDIYHLDSMKELAEQFVDEGLFGDIPERLQFYLDYDAIARDLAVDYSETEIAGQRLIYRCA
ncbi:antirestriction protein ArdA [Stappia sp. ES.058]|uniref:antirestriction protein ArdA n=1 Tax=Stappia sp. ES.058 TaxID=1881061 RepID=UPI000879EF19|nr:antirestriction protein ArdA [Stappia sp. ES.058]SDU42566.1 Antirestriction protein (ArdA) [Stappia sp. ES.058]